MSREVRYVPANWEHPKTAEGEYIPLFDGFNIRAQAWEEATAKWQEGLCDDFLGGWRPIDDEDRVLSFVDWYGERPQQDDFMPDWPAEERTHLQMYENCTEGTPISPVMDTPENLARWLAAHEVSAFGFFTATYEQWLAVCRGDRAIGLWLVGRRE